MHNLMLLQKTERNVSMLKFAFQIDFTLTLKAAILFKKPDINLCSNFGIAEDAVAIRKRKLRAFHRRYIMTTMESSNERHSSCSLLSRREEIERSIARPRKTAIVTFAELVHTRSP